MKHHLARRAEEKLNIALSEHYVTPGLIAALEFIAIKNGDHVLLSVPQMDALAARLRELGKEDVVVESLPDTVTVEDVVRGKYLQSEEPPESPSWLTSWTTFVRKAVGA